MPVKEETEVICKTYHQRFYCYQRSSVLYGVLQPIWPSSGNIHYVWNASEEIIIVDNFLPSISCTVCTTWRWPSWPKYVIKYTKSVTKIKMFLLWLMDYFNSLQVLFVTSPTLGSTNNTDQQSKTSIDEISILCLFRGCWTRIWY